MITVIKSVIYLNIKDTKNFLFMIFFPVFLVIMIGTVLSSIMDSNEGYDLDKTEVYYYSADAEENTLNFLKDIMKDIKDEEDNNLFEFKEVENEEVGKNLVRSRMAIFIVQRNGNIEFYSNDRSLIKSTYAYGTVKAILKEKELKEIVYTNYLINNEDIKEVDFESGIENIEIEKSSMPSSLDYYGVAEIGLMIFYFIQYAMEGIRVDTKSKIKDRIIGSGMSNFKYYLANFIGVNIYSFGSILISYSICKVFLNINYGDIYLLPLAALPYLIIVNGIGIILGITAIKLESLSALIQSIFIPGLTMLGGGYFALTYEETGSLFNDIRNISPLTWFNKSIFNVVYSEDFSRLKLWLLIGLIALVIVIVALYYLGRRSDKNYEKYSSVS